MTEAPLHARLRFRFIFSFRNGIKLFTNNVPLHDLAVLIDAECYRPRFFRGSSEPSARFLTTGLFCSPQGGFGIGMRNLPAGVFGLLHGPARQEGGLIISARPDVVRNLRYRRGNKNGLMWIHGPKANHQMCQTVADALFLPEDKGDIVRKTNVHTFVCREIGNILFFFLDETEKAAMDFE